MVPIWGPPIAAFSNPVLDVNDKKRLADIALNAATSGGASYCDVRIGRYLNQNIYTREDRVQGIVNSESFGVGVRVIVEGTWGFAATSDVSDDGIAGAARNAVAIARANRVLQTEPVQLAPAPAYGEVSWQTPIVQNALEIPISDKVDMLLEANNEAMKAGANFVNSYLGLVNEQKYFASTDGTYADQDVHRIWPTFTVTAVDATTGKFQSREALSAPMGLGWEYLSEGAGTGLERGPATVFGMRYDMLTDARLAAAQAREKLTAKSVDAGKWSLVLDPSHLWLTIHESVGHPLELDRVLGYEANYAGTSFATLDKWESGNFQYGSPIVNLIADKTQVGSLGYVGWDDEGVQTKQWDLVRDGVLVGYQAIRDQVHMVGENASHGCCYADNWSSVQFQRMPNVSLEAGQGSTSAQDVIAGVEKGIFVVGDGSYSIDQQRYNFQFGGQLFYEIENGEITGMLRDVAYQANTQEFWNNCSEIAGPEDYRLGGSFFDGKGQPGQVSAVSHGSSTTRFDDINVINTARAV
jgi:TldD protein